MDTDRIGMSRRVVLGIACAVAALAGCQTLGGGGTVVTGTGDPAKDVAAVQAAADAGGRVVLAGTFDFGERGRVTLTRDVEIVGRDGATIRGGFFTFMSPVPATLPPAGPGPRIAIRDLTFTGALWSPINVGHASALVVSGNRISALRPHPLPMPNIPEGRTQAGVLYGEAWAQGLKDRRYVPGVFTGRVIIERNVIDVRTDAPALTLGYGIYGQWTDGVDATIADNTVTGATRTAFEAIDHYKGPDGSGRIVVRGNRLATAEAGLPFPGPQTPNGILVGYFSDRKAAIDPARAVPMEIEDNAVETHGRTSTGLSILADGVRVRGNTITIDGDTSVAALVLGSDVELAGNVLRGRGGVGVGVGTFDVLAGRGTRLVDNDFGGLQAARAHVVLNKGTSGAVCSGNRSVGKVLDEGQGDRCP